MLSFGLDAGSESFPPLVNGLVHNRLFQVSPDLNKSLLQLPWKPCSWYSTHTKLYKHNESATEWQCTVWRIILGELILINSCRPALGVRFFYETPCRQITNSSGITQTFISFTGTTIQKKQAGPAHYKKTNNKNLLYNTPLIRSWHINKQKKIGCSCAVKQSSFKTTGQRW